MQNINLIAEYEFSEETSVFSFCVASKDYADKRSINSGLGTAVSRESGAHFGEESLTYDCPFIDQDEILSMIDFLNGAEDYDSQSSKHTFFFFDENERSTSYSYKKINNHLNKKVVCSKGFQKPRNAYDQTYRRIIKKYISNYKRTMKRRPYFKVKLERSNAILNQN